jgi:hypothetical protein
MGYRSQPTSVSGFKDISVKGPSLQDKAALESAKREAERKRLAEINKKREEANWRIEQEESLYSADLQAGIRTAANKTNVDYTSLNDSMSNMVSQLSAARIRLKQSSGPYEEMDAEGNVVFNTQTDKAYIKSATDFIKNAETNFGSVAYIQEEFKKIPMGNGEGETSRKFTSPYLGLLNAASNPASGQDVSVSYDMEYDNQTGHKMGIVMKGESVRRLNAQMGNEGDTYTIKPEEISNLIMGNNDPDNFGLFYRNPSTVSELEKKAATNGILDEKDGSVTSDYMIEVDDAFEVVNELTGTKQLATVSQPNYPVIKQNMSGAIKSKLMTTLGKGMVSTSVLINTYAEQDEDGNYFYVPPKKDSSGNIMYTSDGKVDFGTDEEKEENRVYLGDGELEFDMSSDNESFGGLSKDDYEAVYGLIENEFMKRAGVYDPQVRKPYGDKMTMERGLSRAERAKRLAEGEDVDEDGDDRKLAKWEVESKTAEALIGNAYDELSGLTIEQMKDDPTMVEGVLETLLGKTRNNSNAVRVSIIKGVPTAVFVHQDSDGVDIDEFIPLDDMNKFKQRMINISNVYELDDEGIPKLVQGVATAKPTDPVKLKETKVSRALKSKDVLKQGSKDTVAESFVDNILDIKVSDNETIRSLAEAKGLNIEFNPSGWFGSNEIKIGDATIDLSPLDKSTKTAAEIKENKENIKVIQNRILEILEEQGLYTN